MGWFEKSPEKKAEECVACGKVYREGEYKVCDRCGHLYNKEECSCGPNGELYRDVVEI